MNSSGKIPLFRYITVFLFFAMFFNLLLLNAWVYKYKRYSSSSSVSFSSERAFLDEIPKLYETIREATASIRLEPSPLVQETSSIVLQRAREFFIPLGSGTNNTDDWADVAGALAYIDSNNYDRIKRVLFEASVHIPSGNQKAYVRLFNATDKHPVWFSEMSFEGGSPQFLVSNPINLDPGNKLYQVQMKTQLKYKVDLIQSRVHIITN